jgi:hypothetical protein
VLLFLFAHWAGHSGLHPLCSLASLASLLHLSARLAHLAINLLLLVGLFTGALAEGAVDSFDTSCLAGRAFFFEITSVVAILAVYLWLWFTAQEFAEETHGGGF